LTTAGPDAGTPAPGLSGPDDRLRFRLLSVAGAAPPPELAGWKDTVYVPPRTPLELLLGFAQPADDGTPFLYHCHVLWHEDQGMMGQYVVEPVG
jgi:suppressor of ftsI